MTTTLNTNTLNDNLTQISQSIIEQSHLTMIETEIGQGHLAQIKSLSDYIIFNGNKLDVVVIELPNMQYFDFTSGQWVEKFLSKPTLFIFNNIDCADKQIQLDIINMIEHHKLRNLSLPTYFFFAATYCRFINDNDVIPSLSARSNIFKL